MSFRRPAARIAIARALESEADSSSAKKPTSALAVSMQGKILNLMRALQDKFGLPHLFISHNLAACAMASSTA